jgi:hypothetical protein
VTGNFGVKSGTSDSTKDSRKIDQGSEGRCQNILNSLLLFLKQQPGHLSVEFISKDTITDLIIMAQAPVLIGSVSTYSMWAAAMSKGRVILPRAHLWDQGKPGLGATLFGAAGMPGTVELAGSACLKSDSDGVFNKPDSQIMQLLEQPVATFGTNFASPPAPYRHC